MVAYLAPRERRKGSWEGGVGLLFIHVARSIFGGTVSGSDDVPALPISREVADHWARAHMGPPGQSQLPSLHRGQQTIAHARTPEHRTR